MSDTHGELYFARYDARNRLVTGGAVIGPGNKTERLKGEGDRRLQRLWPQIGEVSFNYVWNGYVGMTTDFFAAHSPARTERLRLDRLQRPRGGADDRARQ